MSQHVLHACICGRKAQVVRLLFKPVEAGKCTDTFLRGQPSFQLVLKKTQFLMEARYPSSHRPSVDGRHKPHQWIDHANDWDEEHEQSGDQRGHPEWKIVLQKRTPRFVELRRLVAQRNFHCLGSRELSGMPEYACHGMDLPCGIKQQILDRRMRVATHHEAGLWCQ